MADPGRHGRYAPEYNEFVALYEEVSNKEGVPRIKIQELNEDLQKFKRAMHVCNDNNVGVWQCNFRVVIAMVGYVVKDDILDQLIKEKRFPSLIDSWVGETLFGRYCQRINFEKEPLKERELDEYEGVKEIVCDNDYTKRILTIDEYRTYLKYARTKVGSSFPEGIQLHDFPGCQCNLRIPEKYFFTILHPRRHHLRAERTQKGEAFAKEMKRRKQLLLAKKQEKNSSTEDQRQ